MSEDYYRNITLGMLRVLHEPRLSWREKSMFLLCTVDPHFYTQLELKDMATDGGTAIKSIIGQLVHKDLLIRKEIISEGDPEGVEPGDHVPKKREWKNILTENGKNLIFGNN